MRQPTPGSQDILQPKAHRCACGGSCPRCREQSPIQKKLAISEPGDLYEREADRIAHQVLAAPAHSVVHGTPPLIQTFTAQATGQAEAAPASVDSALAIPGRPLEPVLRQDMEQRFGYDFSRVRVHSGAAAEQSAREVNAHAYTMEHNIVFGAGRFAPGTNEGRRLLAHELTHVVQQSAADGIRVGQSNEKRGLSPISQDAPHTRRGSRLLAHELTYTIEQSLGPRPSGLIIQRQVSEAAASECGNSFNFQFEGLINEAPEKSVPRVYYAFPGKQSLGRLVASVKVSAGQLFGRWRAVCAWRPDMPPQIMWVLDDYVAQEPKKEASTAAPPANSGEPATAPTKPRQQPEQPASAGDPSQCRVEVRATTAGWTAALVGARHLFIVRTDEVGNQWGYRGGPDVPGGVFALIETDFGPYTEDMFPDWDPDALSVTVASGPAACGKKECLRAACRRIDEAEIGYEVQGPNSNSVISELLSLCDVPHQKPDVWAPGWEVQLVEVQPNTPAPAPAPPWSPMPGAPPLPPSH